MVQVWACTSQIIPVEVWSPCLASWGRFSLLFTLVHASLTALCFSKDSVVSTSNLPSEHRDYRYVLLCLSLNKFCGSKYLKSKHFTHWTSLFLALKIKKYLKQDAGGGEFWMSGSWMVAGSEGWRIWKVLVLLL